MALRSFVVVASLLVLCPAWATGQEEAAPPPFGETVQVQVVNVDVYVTDKKGEPITGLKPEDFLLLVDGRPATISNFYEVAGGLRQPEPDAEYATDGAEAGAEAEPAEPLLVVLFVDNYQLRASHRARILSELETFAESVAGDDVRFLVASADPSLSLRSPITKNVDDVRIALDLLGEDPAFGDESTRLWSSTLSSIQDSYEACEAAQFCDPCSDGWGQLIALWELYARSVMGRQGRVGGSLEELFGVFEGVAGRKALVYASSGLEQRPGIDLLQYLIDLCPGQEQEFGANVMRHDETKLLLDLSARANTSRVTIYALHAGGLRTPFAGSAEFGDRRFRPSGLVDRLNMENMRGSMFMLAERTGGTAILNNNAPADALLRDTERDFANYYSIGYRSERTPDGRNHRIRVEVPDAKRGWQVRSRSAWLDKTLDERLVDRAIASMTFGEQSNPLGVRAVVGSSSALDSEAVRVPVVIEIAPERLTLIEDAAGTRQGLFRVFLAAQTPEGERTVLREKFFDVTQPALAAGMQQIVVNVDLEPGDYTIGVGVRDEIGTETSYLALQATAEAPPTTTSN